MKRKNLPDSKGENASSELVKTVGIFLVSMIMLALLTFTTAGEWPSAPTLEAPENGRWENTSSPTFKWSEIVGADNYEIWVDDSVDFSLPEVLENTIQTSLAPTLADGWYYWRVRAWRQGSPGEFSEVFQLGVDTDAPLVPGPLSPGDSAVVSENTPTIRWTKIADTSGVRYELEVDNDRDFSSPELAKENLAENSYTPQAPEALAGGRWYWRVRAVDGAGNPSSWSDVWSFFVDVEGPRAIKLLPENGTSVYDNTPQISALLTDDAAGVKDNMQLFIDAALVTPVYYSAENGWFWYENENLELSEDLHQIELRVWDNLGRFSVITWQFRVDRTSPTRPVLLSPPSPADGATISDTTPAFDWSDAADLSSLVYILQLDDSTAFPSPDNYPSTVSEYTVPAPLAEGTWYWRVVARDNAGNENFSDTWNFTLDTTPPPSPVQISPENGAALAENTPYFSWWSVEEAVGYRLQIDNDQDFSSPVYDNDQLTDNFDNFALHLENALPDGLYYWRIGSLDAVGNAGWSSVRAFLIDTSPPTEAPALVTPPDNYFTNDQTPTFAWTPVTDPTGVTYTLELAKDASFATMVWVVEDLVENEYTPTAPLADNIYYWRVQAVDGLGHLGPISPINILTIDTRVEKPVLLNPDNGSVIDDITPEFDWSDSPENLGPVYKLEISTTSDFQTIERAIDNLTLSSYTLSPAESLSEGTWYWRVFVRDLVYDENGNQTGNENLSDVYFFVIDYTVNATSLLSPPGGAMVGASPVLDWSDVVDPVGPIRYYVFIDNDEWDPDNYVDVWVGEAIWRVSAGGYLSPEFVENSGNLTTSEADLSDWAVGLPQGEYHWRILTADGVPNFAWSAERTFIVDFTPPDPPAFLTPEPGFPPYNKIINDPTPWFCWENSPRDPYPFTGAAVTYTLLIDNDSDFSSPKYIVENIPDEPGNAYWCWVGGEWYWIPTGKENIINYLLESPLSDGVWYWRIKAVDSAGNEAVVLGYRYFIIDTTPPTETPALSQPADGENTSDNTPTLSWSSVPGAYGYEVHYALSENFAENLNIAKVSTTSYTAFEIPDNVWYWRVRCRDDAWNWGPWSQTWSFRVDTKVDAPELLYPENLWIINENKPLLRWTEVSDLSGVSYWAQVDNDPDFLSPLENKPSISENQHEVENALSDGKWYWRAAAVDGLQNYSWSETRCFYVDTSPPTTPAPALPENTSYINDNTPTFAWTRSTDISTVLYRFQLDNDFDFENGVFYEAQGLSDNSLTLPVENSLADGTYRWRVLARDSWGYASDWSVPYQFTVDTQPPTQAPSLLSPAPGENTKDNTPTFSWFEVTGAAGYEVWIDNNSDFSSPEALDNVSVTSFTPAPLADGMYYWRVRVVDAAGNLGVNWSDIWWLRIDNTVGIPVLVEPEADACENDNRPTFRWQPVSDPSPPVVYRLQIDDDPDFPSPLYDNASIVDNGLEIENELPEGNYYWRVWAVDNLGNSGVSPPRGLTIDQTPPSSYVDPIADYWQTSWPFEITITTSDALSEVDNVELWYRYSPDNSTWDPWTLLGIDPGAPWKFDFTNWEGDGHYQLYSVATDKAGNREFPPAEADTSFGLDTASPAVPVLISPEDDWYTSDNTPTLDWQGVPDLSGVSYTLAVATDPSFSTGSLVYYKANLSVSLHELENQLADNRYYWRVRTVDGAGNASPWSENRTLVIDTTPPSPVSLLVPENNSGFNDNTPEFRWTENVDEWVPGGYENYLLQIDNDPDFSSPENFWISDNTFVYPSPGLTEDNYFWHVQVFDRTGNASSWSENFVILSYVPASTLLAPENSSYVADNRPTFRWTAVSDPSGVTYRLIVDNDLTLTSPVYDNSAISENWVKLPPDNALYAWGTWYWRVGTRDGVGNENWSPIWEFNYAGIGKPVLTTGSKPENGVVIRDNTPTFEWTSGENASKHRVIVDNDPDLLSPVDNLIVWMPENTWTRPLPGYPDGTYYWSVWAIDNIGTENKADNTWQFTINTGFVGGPSPLLAPENSSYLSDNTPLFRWTTANPEAGIATISYRLQIDDDPGFLSPIYDNFNLPDNFDNFDQHPENALPDGIWYWRVRAQDNYGNLGPWTLENSFVIDTTLPASVFLLSPADGGYENDNRPVFRWVGGSDVNFLAYRLQVDNDPDFSSSRYDNDNVLEIALELPLDNSLDALGTWYWRVASIDKAGNTTWSDNWSFTYDNDLPSVPSNQSPENNAFVNTSVLTLGWTEVSDAGYENYLLQVDNDNTFDSPENVISDISDNSCSLILEDGVWYWRVRAFDRAGNGSGWSGWFRLTVDTGAPAPPNLLSPADGSFNTSGTVSFKWSEVVDVWAPSFENYTIQIARDEGFTSIYHENSVDDNSYTHSFTEDNIFYWRVRSQDNAGNVGGWSENWRLIVDTTPPGAPSLVSPDNGISLNVRNPVLDWTPVYDLPSGVSYRVQVDNENSFAFPEYDKPGEVQSQHTLENALSEGKWYWRVRAVDGAGNEGTWSENWWFKIDVRVSAPSLLEPASQVTIPDPTPVFKWSEPEAGVTYTLVIDDDSDFSSPIYENSLLADNLDNFDQHPENALPDGLWYWRVHVVDAAGNENVSSHDWFNVDTAVGIPVLLSPENQKAINDNTPRLDWQAVPDISGVSYTLRVMRLDNTLVFEQTSIQTSEFTLTTALPDNFYKWCVGATDGIGNENWSENWIFEVDTVAPALQPSLLSPAPGAFVNTACPTFAWSYVAGADNYQLQIAVDQAFVTTTFDRSDIRDNIYTLSQLEAMPDGIYYWRVRAGDNAGNAGPWSENRKLTVDTEAPSAPSLLLPGLGAYENDNTPVFTWIQVSDPSGVVYRLQIDNDPDFSSPRYDNSQLTDNLDNFDQHPENALPDGVWYWRVLAADNAGNSPAWVARWVLIDTRPPTKPSGLIPSGILRDDPTPNFDWLGVSNSSGVTYELQTATDNAFVNLIIEISDLLLSEYPSPALPENLYYWRVKAVDRAGNQGPWSDNLQLVLDFAGPLPRDDLFWLWVHEGTENEENRSITPCEINFVNDLAPRLWFLLEDRGVGLADNFTVELDNSAGFPSPVQLVLSKSYLENRDGAYMVVRAENALDPLAEGHWYLRLRAWDNIPQAYGGPHFTELVYHFVVDLTPPPEAPEWLENSWYNDNTPSFSWTEIWDNEEENRKVQRYELRITRGSSVNENVVYDNAWIYDDVVGDNTVTHTIPDENALAECENYYRWVRGIDNAGNPGPWSEGRWFGVDVTPPSSSVTSPTQAQASTPFQVAASASDNLSGVENMELWYRYSSNGTSWTGWASFGIDNDGGDGWSWSFTASEGRGLYQFYCIATDAAGNHEPVPATADLEVKFGYTITVSVSPTGGGAASASPTIALAGETVTLSATPASGYSFSSWSGYLNTTSNPASFSMPASSVSVTANFTALQTYTLTISVNPQGGGTTSPSPGQHSYTVGSAVSVTASPATGYKFVNWSGDVSGTSATIQVTMNSNLSITANFELQTYTITVSADPAGGGDVSVSPGATVNYGTSVTVTATPASGYEFAGWEGYFTDNENNPKTFSMPAEDITLTAKFREVGIPTYRVSVGALPPEGGEVTISPSSEVSAGTRVTVTAEPAPGYEFERWTGDFVSTENPYEFTMPSKDVLLVARFREVGVTLPIAWIGVGVAAAAGILIFFKLRAGVGVPKERW